MNWYAHGEERAVVSDQGSVISSGVGLTISTPGLTLAISFGITLDNPDHQDKHQYQ
jgi:hypothetical protein